MMKSLQTLDSWLFIGDWFGLLAVYWRLVWLVGWSLVTGLVGWLVIGDWFGWLLQTLNGSLVVLW